MADNNLPATAGPDVTTPPTDDQLVDDLANLLEPPETDLPEEPEDNEAAAVPDDDPLGLDAEDVEANASADNPDGPEAEIKGGRFAPDSAKVKLDDGTTITIAELKRNNLYHAGFTQKTQALSEERKSFDAERQKVAEYAQSLNQSRDYLEWYAETYLPKNPGPWNGADDDFVGYQKWQKDVAAWQTHAQAYQVFQGQKQQDAQKREGETKAEAEKRMVAERTALLEAIPVLKDKVKGPAAWSALVSGATQHYGITEQEVNTVGDHRLLKVLRDALAYQRIKGKAQQAPNEIARKPVLKTGARKPPEAQAVKGRQERTEQLRNRPTFENGVKALMDFDL